MKNERIRLFFIGMFCCFIFCVIAIIFSCVEYQSYKKSVNDYVYGMISSLKEKYPNITEKEIVEILNSKNRGNYQEEFRKYGINEDSPVLYSLENNYKKSLLFNLSLILFMTFVFLILFFGYYFKKEKSIREITKYMKAINEKNYSLGISENQEGELSILRNEVYKTTIMLREESEILKKEKISLKDSISDISHQLKTPLTSILILLDNILENPDMDDHTKNDFIANVHHQVENIHFLLISLLKVSRIEAGVVEFKKEVIDWKKLIDHALKNVAILKEVKKIQIHLECEKVFSKGDYNWELEAITNLLKNAIEHSYEDGKIDILVSDNPLYTKVVIQDYGSGMNEKDLKNIFKRFYKGENSCSDSIGIGLNLVKNIVEKDNGYIKVDSKEGVGTTFEIRYMKQ